MDMFPQTDKSLKTGMICSDKRTKATDIIPVIVMMSYMKHLAKENQEGGTLFGKEKR